MNSYEQKVQARRERYAARAVGAAREAEGASKAAHAIMDNIPLGQPILIGHHSEKRHRRDIARVQRNMERWSEAKGRAEHYARKAESYGTHGISADDPDAVAKLEAELEMERVERDMEKAANADMRKASKAWVKKHGGTPGQTEHLVMIDALTDITPELRARLQSAARAFPWLPQFGNSSAARIKRLEERIEALKRRDAAPERESVVGEWEGLGFQIDENRALNRVQITLKARAPKELYARLKGSGFKWAKTQECFQRQLTPAAWAAALRILNVETAGGAR